MKNEIIAPTSPTLVLRNSRNRVLLAAERNSDDSIAYRSEYGGGNGVGTEALLIVALAIASDCKSARASGELAKEFNARRAASTVSAYLNGNIPSEIRARLVGWYGENAVAFAERAGTKVRVLRPGEEYRVASKVLSRMGSGAVPENAAGLFVVAERTVYLRSTSDMVVAHEFAHALDCSAGRGLYYSAIAPQVRRAYNAATGFVTPYAASACDEFFAESVRAYVEVNDVHSFWPKATKQALRAKTPEMYAIVEKFFAQIDAGAEVIL